MKEATGELNATVVVVISIGILSAFFYYTVWPTLNDNFTAQSKCSKAWCENPCGEGSGKNSCGATTAKCYYGNDRKVITCPWKG